jgi:hypothetical protein
MLKIRDYEKGDIYRTVVSGMENILREYVNDDSVLIENGYTALYGDRIVACAGLKKLWGDVYEAWLSIDEESKNDYKIAMAIVRVLKKSLDDPVLEKVQRVGAHVSVSIPNHKHFMSLLGFKPEAVLKNYFPNRTDCVVYRRGE